PSLTLQARTDPPALAPRSRLTAPSLSLHNAIPLRITAQRGPPPARRLHSPGWGRAVRGGFGPRPDANTGATMNNNNQLRVFSGRANVPLAEKIAQCLGDPLGKITLQNFPDGETWCRIDEDVRGRDVFVVQPTCPPVNENLMELLVILDSLKRASAARITPLL